MCQPPKEPPVDAAAAIKELYARHDPDKLNEVDALLTKFAGREAQLLQAVTAKYCPDDVDRFARIVKLFSEDADDWAQLMLREEFARVTECPVEGRLYMAAPESQNV